MNYKEKIKIRGLKMTWIADQCGVSKAALSNYLNEKREMPINVKAKLNQLLK